jgi:DNA-binding transcriptional MerR regulator
MATNGGLSRPGVGFLVVDDLLSPAEVARRLDIAPSTLRLYSGRFAEFLSDQAARPRPMGPNRPGYRRYSAADVALLARAKERLSQGMSYEQVADALAGNRQAAPVPVRPVSEEGSAVLQQVVSAWRELADERGREVTRLREELTAAREEIRQLRSQLETSVSSESRRGRRFLGGLLGGDK